MTTPPAFYGKFGLTLAFAERALTELLHEHLAHRGIEPDTRYAVRLIARGHPALPARRSSKTSKRPATWPRLPCSCLLDSKATA